MTGPNESVADLTLCPTIKGAMEGNLLNDPSTVSLGLTDFHFRNVD